RLEIIRGAEAGPGEQALAPACSIVARPLLKPALMHRVGLGGHDHLAAGGKILQRRLADLADLCAEAAEEIGRRLDRRRHLRIAGDICCVEMPDDADAQPAYALAEGRAVIWHRLVGAGGVERVVSCDHLQHQRVVAHAARHRPDMVEREGEWKNAAPADATIGGLHPGNPALRGGIADRAAGVGAERCRKQPSRQPDAAAARRAAGEMPGVPGIARRRPGQVEGRAADGEFMGGELAEQDAAGRFEPCRHRRVRGREVVGEQLRMRRRRQPLDIDDVLERVRDAVEGAAPASGGDLGLGLPRHLERPLGQRADEGIEAAVEAIDACEQRRRQLDWRELPRADQRACFGDAEKSGLAHASAALARKISAISCAGGRSRGRRATCRSMVSSARASCARCSLLNRSSPSARARSRSSVMAVLPVLPQTLCRFQPAFQRRPCRVAEAVGVSREGGAMAEQESLPLTLLTGFLGSGKTSLLKRALADPAWSETAVLINELGEIGLDHYLVDTVDGPVLELPGGCLCCAIREDLAASLRGLLERRAAGALPPFRRIAIETTGLADPAPILFTLGADAFLDAHLHLDRVVTTVDAVTGEATLARFAEAARQVAIADRLVLTKTDLAPPAEALRGALAALNPEAASDLAGAETGGAVLFGAIRANRMRPAPEPTGAHSHGIASFALILERPCSRLDFARALGALA